MPAHKRVTTGPYGNGSVIPTMPCGVRRGNANNRLFTEFSANKIASITTNGVPTESPEGITAGVASRVWFLGVGTKGVHQTVVPR